MSPRDALLKAMERTVTLKVYRNKRQIGKHKIRVYTLKSDFHSQMTPEGKIIGISGADEKNKPFMYAGEGLSFDLQ